MWWVVGLQFFRHHNLKRGLGLEERRLDKVSVELFVSIISLVLSSIGLGIAIANSHKNNHPN